MAGEYQLKKLIVDIGKRIYQNGFVAANDGNISIKISDDEYLCTPTGVSKGFMSVEDIIKVNGSGEKISGRLQPSSEIKMHLEVYRQRDDVGAVVHAHPPTATAFAVAGMPLEKPIMPEVVISLGWVPVAEYGTPSTEEIPEAIRKYLQCHDALLLQNHGALTVGTDVVNAYYKMETLELAAKISLAAKQLGRVQEITPDNVQKLLEVRRRMGIPGRHPSECQLSPTGANESGSADELTELVRQVTLRVLKEMGQ